MLKLFAAFLLAAATYPGPAHAAMTDRGLDIQPRSVSVGFATTGLWRGYVLSPGAVVDADALLPVFGYSRTADNYDHGDLVVRGRAWTPLTGGAPAVRQFVGELDYRHWVADRRHVGAGYRGSIFESTAAAFNASSEVYVRLIALEEIEPEPLSTLIIEYARDFTRFAGGMLTLSLETDVAAFRLNPQWRMVPFLGTRFMLSDYRTLAGVVRDFGFHGQEFDLRLEATKDAGLGDVNFKVGLGAFGLLAAPAVGPNAAGVRAEVGAIF